MHYVWSIVAVGKMRFLEYSLYIKAWLFGRHVSLEYDSQHESETMESVEDQMNATVLWNVQSYLSNM